MTEKKCSRFCREIKNINYYRQCKATVSRKGISSLLALSQLNTNRRFSTTENTIIASNACAFRVITNYFSRSKNASGRNHDFTHRLRNSSTVVNSIASTIAIQKQYHITFIQSKQSVASTIHSKLSHTFPQQSMFRLFSAVRSVSSLFGLLLEQPLETNLSRRP